MVFIKALDKYVTLIYGIHIFNNTNVNYYIMKIHKVYLLDLEYNFNIFGCSNNNAENYYCNDEENDKVRCKYSSCNSNNKEPEPYFKECRKEELDSREKSPRASF